LNKNGFLTAIVSVIIIVLLSTTLFVQSTAIKTKKTESNQRAIFELKGGMQNTQQLMDKAVADAMSDCYNRLTCELVEECKLPEGTKDYSAKINPYMQTVIEASLESTGIECSTESLPSLIDNDNVVFTFDLVCRRSFYDGFSVEIKKPIPVDKTITTLMVPNPPGVDKCTIKVFDNQSGTCDFLANLEDCT